MHLDSYGSGSFHRVSTGNSTYLGYSGSIFSIGFAYASGNMTAIFSASVYYGDSYGVASISIEQNGVTIFDATFDIEFSNHKFGRLSNPDISYAQSNTTSFLENCAEISLVSAREASNNCTTYLQSNGFDPIF